MDELKDIESKLNEHVKNFHKWVKDTYTPEEIANGHVDDPGYSGWNAVEKDIAILFNEFDVRALTETAIGDLLYLIGRNWDLGWIINWLTTNTKQLSNVGDLTEEEFYYLCQKALDCDDEDAQCQFPANFKKFESLTPQREQLLLAFCRSKHIYTHRVALGSLLHLEYPKMEELIIEAWDTGDEWARIDCLWMLKELKSPLLEQFEERGLVDGRTDLMEYFEKYHWKNNP